MTQTLLVYPHLGGWAFDDPRHDLVAEAFVQGADTVMDILFIKTHGAGQVRRPIEVTFDSQDFPLWQLRLIYKEHSGQDPRTVSGIGDVYLVEGQSDFKGEDLMAWLCPALLHYFPEPPKQIYVRADAMKRG